jgi:hypothetical protein
MEKSVVERFADISKIKSLAGKNQSDGRIRKNRPIKQPIINEITPVPRINAKGQGNQTQDAPTKCR